MLNDKTSTIKIHLWLPFTAAYDFLNLFRVIDFRDLHTACENRGGGRDFVLEFRKKRRMRRHLTQNFRKLRG